MSLDNSVSVGQVTQALKVLIEKHFPKSFVNVSKGALSGDEHQFIYFALGAKGEWNHGIINNDPAYHIFSITQERGKFVIETANGSLSIAPTNPVRYSSSLKVFRKISNADNIKLEKSFDAFLVKLKAAIKTHADGMTKFAPFDIKSKI